MDTSEPINQDVEAQLMWCGLNFGPGGTCAVSWDMQTTGTPGWQWLSSSPGAATIDNSAGFYRIRILLKPGASPNSTMFRRAMFAYHLNVPPGTPTFNDVDATSPYYNFVSALAASGITAGCGGGNFCPDAPVTRAQMATFLTKGLGLYWPVMIFSTP